MIASVFGALRLRSAAAFGLAMLACVTAQKASAADCPGHPDAIGTSRTIVVDPRQYPIIGTMQYGKTLPLKDREVVLTFDDGPLPKYSNQILDILAAHCAKATFFLVGRQASDNPEGVRKVRDAGHTVATHTQNHPTGMDRLPLDRSRQEIEQGIASVTAALADGTAPAPFVRMPGLRTNDGIEEYARAKGLQVWSADFPADDWRDVSAARVYELAMKRLHAKGKGILLLHDIQPRTVAALPRILHELKVRGYRIVHVVPAARDGQRRRPSRNNGSCIQRRRWWPSRFGQKFRGSCLPALPPSPPLRCPASAGAALISTHAHSGARAAFPCHAPRSGRDKQHWRSSRRLPRCPFRPRAFSSFRNQPA